MDRIITRYQYLFYCFARLTGDGHSFYFRVTSLLSIGTSFLLGGLFIFTDNLLTSEKENDLNNLWMLGIWFGNYAIHIAYFQTGDRDEKTVEKFEGSKEGLNPKVLAILYLTLTFRFFLSTFWISGYLK